MSKAFVGKTILKMQIADDKGALLFVTDAGDVVVRADGDCCSHTWIESVELPALGFPALVTAVEDLAMPDLGSPDNYDVIAYYGCKVSTDKGDIVIDYRNSSNGYYGGNLVWPAAEGEYDYFYGGVYGQNVSLEKWIDIGSSDAAA